MKESSESVGGIEDLKNKELFKNVKYYIIGKTHDQLRKLLADGGAKESNYLTQLVTLVIADDASHSEVDEAADVFDIPVVTSRWVLLSAKCGVLLPKTGFQPNVAQIFSGVWACPSQVDPKDSNALWAMITFNGGKYSLDFTSSCTHLIATKTTSAKYVYGIKTGASQVKIVTPDWVFECIKTKKRQEEGKYHPRLLSIPVPPAPISFETRPVNEPPTTEPEDSPLEGLLLPENVALQLESILDDVVSGRSIELPMDSTPHVSSVATSHRKLPVLMSPTIGSSNLETVAKVNTAPLTVSTSAESESAPLQMKSSQWMTQQVQGVFSQQQQSLSPASNASPTFNAQPNVLTRDSSNNWTGPVEGQMKEVQISSGKVQQVVRVAVPPQYLVQQRLQQPPLQQQQQPQLQQSQMVWQQQQPPLRSPGTQQPQQPLLMRPQQVQWHQGQMISQQQAPRQIQMTPQQRAQVLAMHQQQHQATQHQLQQTVQRPMPPAWQRQGIPPRDSAPQFIGQPQTQMTTVVRPVMVQRTGVAGGQPQGNAPGTTFWYQRGQHPQQLQGRVAWQQHSPQREMINIQQMQQQQQQLQPQQQLQSQQLQQMQQQQSQQMQQQQSQQMQQQQSQQMQQQQSQQMQQQQSQQMQQQQSQQMQQQQSQQMQHQQTQQMQQQQTQQQMQSQQLQQQQLPPQQTQLQSQQIQQQLQSQQLQQLQSQQLQQQQLQPQQMQQQQLQPQQMQQQQLQTQHLQQQLQPQQLQQQQLQQQQLQSQQMPQQSVPRTQSDQVISLQMQRDEIQVSPQRYPMQVQQQSTLKDAVTAPQDRQQMQTQQQSFIREPTPQQMIIQREILHQEVAHPPQVKDSNLGQHLPGTHQSLPQQVQVHQGHQPANVGQKMVAQPTQQQSQMVQQHLQQQQQQPSLQQQRDTHQLAQPMPQLKIRESVPVSTPGTPVSTVSNWPPPSPQAKQMLCQQQQLQQQAQRQIHPQSLAQHIQILQQQQQAQLRASIGQMRQTLIQQQVQRPLGHIPGQPIQQRAIIPQRIAVTGFGNVTRYHSVEPPTSSQPQVHSSPNATIVTSGSVHEQQQSQQQTSVSPMPVQQQTQTPSPRDSLHQVVQQGQEQIQQQLQNLANLNQPQQVTPKTKTALANLLNNRLQLSPRVPETEMVAQPAVARFPGPGIQQQPQPGQPPREPIPTDHQRTLRNITNSGNATVLVRAAGGPKQGTTRFVPPSQFPIAQPPLPRVQFFAHDPAFKVPPDLCLLGCVFCIIDYDRIIDADMLKVWMKVIEQHGGELDSNYGPRCTHVLCDNQRNSIVQQAMREGKRCITATWLNDVIAAKRMIPPWSALHFPTPFSEDKPCKNQIISITNFEGDERQRLRVMILQTGARYTNYFSRSNTLLVCKKAEGIKHKSAKEWKIPCVNVEWLQDVLYGHYDALRLLFAQKYVQFGAEDPFKVDYALVPHLMAAWRIPVRVTEEIWKKFVPNSAALTTLIQERNKRKEEVERKAKRLRQSPPLEENVPITTRFPPAKENRPVVLFTGINGTTDLSRKVLELGGLIAKNYKECTHLVTDSVCRTVKFMCALNVCKYVLAKSWILESAKENRFIDEKLHLLQDPPNENHFGCYIKEIMARTDRTPLFKNLTFYLTPGLKPSVSLIKEIIESAGGIVIPKCPPFKEIISTNKSSPVFIIITCDNDSHLCKEMIKKNIGVYNVEFVLSGVMRQEIDFKAFSFTIAEPNGTKPNASS